jgi:hypothetical protein
MATNIHSQAITLTAKLCRSQNILLDPPRYEDSYSCMHLVESHGIQADFFIRKCTVGFSIRREDQALLTLLNNLIDTGKLQILVPGRQEPVVSVTHKEFFVKSIASGDLRETSSIVISSEPSTFEKRADDLAILLFQQWISKIMPVVETYKQCRDAGILK